MVRWWWSITKVKVKALNELYYSICIKTKTFAVHTSKMRGPVLFLWILLVVCVLGLGSAYDPSDESLKEILPAENSFEPFYPREEKGMKNGAARADHSHGSFYSHRNPALVEVRNAPAFGFRFDGKRRFNFD